MTNGQEHGVWVMSQHWHYNKACAEKDDELTCHGTREFVAHPLTDILTR